MSQIGRLEELYNSRVRVDSALQKDYQGLLEYVMTTLITMMKQVSPMFGLLYRETYFGGSFFDGLKVNSTDQEFDLNIVFKWNPKDLKVAKVSSDAKNFTFLEVAKQFLNTAESSIVDKTIISPIKMFSLLKSSVDAALTSLNHGLTYQGQSYRITRHEFAPVTLVIKALDGSKKCEVDLLPAVKMELEALLTSPALYAHVTKICDDYGVSRQIRNCMAISLHRLDKEKIHIDFHDVESSILYNKLVTKKIKYSYFRSSNPLVSHSQNTFFIIIKS